MAQNYTHKFPLENGKWVYVQSDDQKLRSKNLVGNLHKRWAKPKHFFHFKEGGHIKAISHHDGSKYFATIDLKNFFGHITKSKIIRALKKLHISFPDADEIANISSIGNYETNEFVLPFGFTQSPILASIVLDKSLLGRAIKDFIKDGINVSVYVDDIILSGNNKAKLIKSHRELMKIVEKSGFKVNQEKSQAVSDKITTFNIIISKHDVELTSSRFSKFLHDLNVAENDHVVDGILGYVSTVNLDQLNSLRHQSGN